MQSTALTRCSHGPCLNAQHMAGGGGVRPLPCGWVVALHCREVGDRANVLPRHCRCVPSPPGPTDNLPVVIFNVVGAYRTARALRAQSRVVSFVFTGNFQGGRDAAVSGASIQRRRPPLHLGALSRSHGRGRYPPPPPFRAPSLCPATVPLMPTSSINGICNRQ